MRMDALVPGFEPESPRERALAADPLLRSGLAWGRPRPGHPEGAGGARARRAPRGGAVGPPVAAPPEATAEHGAPRAVRPSPPLAPAPLKSRARGDRPSCRDNAPAVPARRFAERYTPDERLLAALE